MHIHVKLLPTFSAEPCSLCGATEDSVKFTVFAGTGNSETEPICSDCFSLTGWSLEAKVEQADLSPGRSAPGWREKKRAKKQEREVAEDLNGRTQPGSGNQAHSKGDVRVKGKFRVENKFTRNKSFALTREVLSKISGECVGFEKPVLHVDFVHPTTLKSQGDYVVVPYEDWKELVDASGKSE